MRTQDCELQFEFPLESDIEDKEFRMIFDLTQDLVKDAILAFRKLER